SQLKISVNISLQEFKQPLFVAQLTEIVAKTGLQLEHLNLDIKESMTYDKVNSEITLRRLRELGVSISIDDFGTGYFSFGCLTTFPVTHLKIDQAFVQGQSANDQGIITTIITLAKSLQLTVIAEGVETVEQERFLQQL